MTHHQIEDVLSSIRRLVSDDPRSRPEPPPPAIELLVLTPALRIVAGSGEVKTGMTPTPGDAAQAITGPVADAGSPVTTPAVDEQMASSPLPAADTTPPATGYFGPAALHLAFISHGSVTDASPATDDSDPAIPALPVDTADAALLLPFVLPGDAGPSQPPAPPPVEPDVVEAVDTVQDGTPVFRSRRDADDAPGDVPGGASGDRVRNDLPMPADDPDDAMLTGSLRTDAPPAPVNLPVILDAANAVATQGDMATDHADPMLDEAAIATIVRAIVHDELQGALGERITRNVRKLVRAEIQRILAARDVLGSD